MNNRALLCTGLVGTLIAALCCFTPMLVILLGVVGLSALTGYLDYILLPALAVFVCILLIAIYRVIRDSQNSRLTP